MNEFRYITWCASFVLALSILVLTVKGQEFTEREETIIINRIDSLVQQYNLYGTFVEDVGYFSSTVGKRFIGLFDQEAYLFNDIDPDSQRPILGIFAEIYVEQAKKYYPSGFYKSEFSEISRSEIKPTSDNQEYSITLTGEKSLLARDGFRRNYNDYEIIVAFNKDLDHFRIAGTRLKNLKITPPKRIELFDIEFIVLDPENQPHNATVTLKLDEEALLTEYTDNKGVARFSQLPKKDKVVVSARSNSDPSLETSKEMRFDEMAKSRQIRLVLEPFKSREFIITVINSKTKEPISAARVEYQEDFSGNWKSAQVTDRKGQTNIISTSYDGVIQFRLEKEGYKTVQQTQTYRSEMAKQTLLLTPNPFPQMISLIFAPAMLMTLGGEAGGAINWQINKELSYNFGAEYNVFPFKSVGKSMKWGLYTQIAMGKEKFTVAADSFGAQYDDYLDPDGDPTILIVNSGPLTEDYNLLTLGFGAGLIAKKELSEKLFIQAGLGPILNVLPVKSADYAIDHINFSGYYAQFFETKISDHIRYGYGEIKGEAFQISANELRSIFMGINMDLLVGWSFSEKADLLLGLDYMLSISNILKSEPHNHLAYLEHDGSALVTGFQYYGLLNQLNSFRLSYLGIKLGISYRFR